MTRKLRVLFLIALLFSVQPAALAESKPLELRWNELAGLIGGHRVAIDLTEGGTVKGEVISVREDSLLLDVSGAAKGYPKGNGSIPRASVNLIHLERTRGAWGRSMGTVIGVLTGMTLGGYIAAKTANSAGPAIGTFLGVASGVSVAGYYAGKGLDKKTTLVKIVP